MNKILVTIFDSESQAREGSQALLDLHSEGGITVYAAAVITKAANGQVNVEGTASENPLLGLALGPLVGGLAGLLGGSLGALAGVGLLTASVGALAGVTGAGFVSIMLDFVKVGGREDFTNEVASYLLPGKAAVVADVDEDQVLPTDTRLEAAGGVVFRQPRTDAEYLLIERDLAALKAEVSSLHAESIHAAGTGKTKIQARIEGAETKLRAQVERAKTLEEATQRVADAKVKSLEEQMATAQGTWKTDLQQRAVRVRADYNERVSRLRQAWEAAQEVLSQ